MTDATLDRCRFSALSRPRHVFRRPALSRMGCIWLLLAAMYLAYAVWLNPRIFYASDDPLYTLMARSMAMDHSFYLKNGYDETHSPLFVYMQFYIPAPNGEMTAQYPPLYPVFAAPFFLLFGTDGLLYFNALMFLACTWLVFRCTLLMFEDLRLAHAAGLIFALATFAGPLALLALAHIAAATVIMSSFYCSLLAVRAQKPNTVLYLALTAGLLEGIATGMRLDSLLALAGAAGPLIFAPRPRPMPLISFAAGLGLVLFPLLLFNHLRFGSFNLFSYGTVIWHPVLDYHSYIPQVIMLALVCACGFLYIQLAPEKQRHYGAPLFLASVIALTGAVPYVPGWVWFNLHTILWDAGESVRPVVSDRALLQSCPFLIVLPLGWWLAFRHHDRARETFLLSLVPLIYTLVFGTLGASGFIPLYERYFAPALPFASILMAYLLLQLGCLSLTTAVIASSATAAALAYITWGLNIRAQDLAENFFVLFRIPHFITWGLLALSVLCIAADLSGRYKAQAFRLAGGAIIAVMAWSVLVFYFKDQPALMDVEQPFAETRSVAALLPGNALLLMSNDQLRYIAAFYNTPDIRVAMQPLNLPPASDEEVMRVVKYYYVGQGRSIFTYFTDPAQREHLSRLLSANGLKPAVCSPKEPALLHWTY